MYIEIANARKTFLKKNGETFVALEDVSLSIDRGEFVCLLGGSGCGKSTLLNAIAGFTPLTSGSISIDGKPVRGPNQDYVMVFQQYGLLPWRSVRKNVELGLESRKFDRKERSKIAKEYLELVGLAEFAEQTPRNLSGGQQQRVAIARALAVKPAILFMDEPFGALDPITRCRMQMDLQRIVRTEAHTVIFVTHDIDEAICLADRIVLMEPNPGRIKRIFPVELGHLRYRSNPDFIAIRQRILREFFPENDRQIEYYI